ncbi:uncharacterized protein PgNI_04151 [Pyricularia grisea]|uniref:Uncharacterized protein n=1 Tax=Pyricularia grisea TaxID=148305 RepID=A0A6P8BE52_PYRGI|nr:uncharacterized protein PgNI_04151 [Pyricularia grisea]TLD14156.1 hypothetical protein PgNI_04151 [Pyricularia grisea]
MRRTPSTTPSTFCSTSCPAVFGWMDGMSLGRNSTVNLRLPEIRDKQARITAFLLYLV